MNQVASVVELRQYTLRTGKRDVLIDLFDRELVETQEAVGMRVVGQFRDSDDPDRFVWLRSFPDMDSRRRSLAAFYGGPVWRAHGKAANATMIDSDNVLLLRPICSGFPDSARPGVGTTEIPPSLVLATICYRETPFGDEFIEFFEQDVIPALVETSGAPLAYFETEYAENTFPALPVRTGENVFVWFSWFPSREHYDAYSDSLARSETWTEKVLPKLLGFLSRAPQERRLRPTSRSALR